MQNLQQDLELQLQEVLSIKSSSSLEYLVRASSADASVHAISIVCAKPAAVFECEGDLQTAKEAYLRKQIIYQDCIKRISCGQSSMAKAYAKLLDDLTSREHSDDGGGGSHAKQTARFRIKKSEQALLAASQRQVQPAEFSHSFSASSSAFCSHKKLGDVCRRLALGDASLVYQENKTTGLAKCSLSLLGEHFEASEYGGCKAGLQERLAAEALAKFSKQFALMQPAPAAAQQQRQPDKYTPAFVGRLVEVDLGRVAAGSQAESQRIPQDIISRLISFARRRSLQPPSYELQRQVGGFGGKAGFAGHCFDLDGKVFGTKSEAKHQVAYLIWLSLQKACGPDFMCAKQPVADKKPAHNRKYTLSQPKPSHQWNGNAKRPFAYGNRSAKQSRH